MANSFTTALNQALAEIVPAAAEDTKIIPLITNYGAVKAYTYKVPVGAGVTAQAKSNGTDVTYQDTTLAGGTITMSSHWVMPVKIEDGEQGTTPLALARSLLRDNIPKLLNKMDATVAALYSDLTTEGTNMIGTLGAGLDMATVRKARRLLLQAKVNPEYLVMSPQGEDDMLTDETFAKIYSPQLADSYLTGKLPRVAGFGVETCNAIATPATGQYVNLAFDRSAFAIAFCDMMPEEADAQIGRQVIRYVHPTAGIVIYIVQGPSGDLLGRKIAIHAKWGVLTVDSNRAIAIKS